jgi:hypothetical protein
MSSVANVEEAVRFDDLAPDDKILFLDEAIRHGEFDPTSHDPSGFMDLAAVWACSKCGAEHSMEDTLVADGIPQCPKCGASGWGDVAPKPRAT